MSAITINGDLVHYEVLGRGKPVILLHSWLGSWRYWIPAMQQLSVKYRTYAVDLWGFGDSGKNKLYYGIDGQADLLQQFIDRMGIPKAVFVGHGLGAAVLAYFATKPESREVVHRMMVISPPLFGRTFASGPATSTSTNIPVNPARASQSMPALPTVSSDTGSFALPTPGVSTTTPLPPVPSADMPTVTRISRSDRDRLLMATGNEPAIPSPLPPGQSTSPATPPSPPALPPTPPPTSESSEEMPSPTIPGMEGSPNPMINVIGRMKPSALLTRHMDTSSSDYEKLKGEVDKADEEALAKSVQSLSRYNTMYYLIQAKAPTMAVMGATDTFVTVPNEAILQQLTEREQFRVIILPNTRHFPMLEDVTKFTRLLREFFDAPDLDQLEIKDEWRRRTR